MLALFAVFFTVFILPPALLYVLGHLIQTRSGETRHD